MATKEFELRRNRLLHAAKIWAEKGIVGSAGSVMRELIRMYRGEQWDRSWRGLDGDELIVVNKIFPFANQQQASIVSRNPRTLYTARKEVHELSAPAVQELHDYDIREQAHKRQFKAAFRAHQFAPFGCVRHGYTPPEEIETESGRRIDLYRNANPNRPWLRAVMPWNVMFDTRVDDLSMDGGMRWVAFRDVTTKARLKANENVTIASQKLEQLQGSVSADWSEMLDPTLLSDEDPERAEIVEIWSVYEIEERVWYQTTLSGLDDYVRKPADWPIPWEWLPANFFCVNEQLDTPFALSLLEELSPLQREYNQVRTLIHQGVLRSRKQNFYNKLAFGDDEELAKATLAGMGEWIGLEGDVRAAVYAGQTGGLPQESLQHLAILDGEMREVLAQSKMKRGDRVNVESGSEAQGILMGQEESEARIEDEFGDFVRDTESLFMQGRRYIMHTVGSAAHEVVRLVGQKDGARIVQYATVDAAALHGEYDFEIEAGSMRPRNRDVEAQQAAVDLDIAMKIPNVASVPYAARTYYQKRGIDPAQALLSEAQQAAAAEAAGATLQGASGQGQPRAVDANVIAALRSGQGRR